MVWSDRQSVGLAGHSPPPSLSSGLSDASLLGLPYPLTSCCRRSVTMMEPQLKELTSALTRRYGTTNAANSGKNKSLAGLVAKILGAFKRLFQVHQRCMSQTSACSGHSKPRFARASKGGVFSGSAWAHRDAFCLLPTSVT